MFHKTRKRFLSPAFSIKYVSSLEPSMSSCVQTLVGIIHDAVMNNNSEKPTTINLYQCVQAAAFDIIGETAFGESFKLLENGEHPLPIKVYQELRRRVLRASFPFLKPFLQQDPYTEEVSIKQYDVHVGLTRLLSITIVYLFFVCSFVSFVHLFIFFTFSTCSLLPTLFENELL